MCIFFWHNETCNAPSHNPTTPHCVCESHVNHVLVYISNHQGKWPCASLICQTGNKFYKRPKLALILPSFFNPKILLVKRLLRHIKASVTSFQEYEKERY